MCTSSSAPLAAYVQRLIQETFEVSEAEANDRAMGYLSIAEGWGTPETAANLDWLYRDRKDLGKTHKWRSDKVRQEFEAMQNEKVKAYEQLMDHNKASGRIPI